MITKVFLREKKISKGRKSLYLDFYPPIKHPRTGKKTRREFLGLYIFEKPRSAFETQHNKQNRSLAESVRGMRFKEIQNGTYGFQSEAKKNTSFIRFFEKLVGQKYTSEGNYGNWLSAFKVFREYFPNELNMGELSADLLEEFRDYMLSLGLATNTKHTYYNKIRAAIREAFRKGYIPVNYAQQVPSIKSEETRREFVSKEELEILASTECDNPILKKAFLFSALTGLRFSDIHALYWSDIHGSENSGHYIRFRQKKTKGQETLPISASALRLLGPREFTDKKVFEGLLYSAWQNLKLREWVLRAGIHRKITFHCARHSFATIQLTLGTDIYTVSKLLGHKDLKTTQVYAKIVDKRKVAAVSRLDNINLNI